MFKQLTYITVGVVLSLAGCNSFTLSYQKGDTTTAKEIQHTGPQPDDHGVTKTNPVDTEASVIDKLTEIQKTQQAAAQAQLSDWCPKYRAPILPPPPVAPLDKLNQLKPTDTAAIEALDRNYIVELSDWIAKSQATITKSYHDYVVQCETAKKKKQ
jgi:hypothetical protein